MRRSHQNSSAKDILRMAKIDTILSGRYWRQEECAGFVRFQRIMRTTFTVCIGAVALLAGILRFAEGGEIHEAVVGDDVAEIGALLEKTPEQVNARAEKGGSTPLHLAAICGHPEAANLLITKGADINAKMGMGLTPLHCAILEDSAGVVGLLIEKGADVNAATETGRTCLHFAVIKNDQRLARLLTASGADINATANDGSSPLNLAKEKNISEMVEILVGTSRGPEEESPVDIAKQWSFLEAMEVLVGTSRISEEAPADIATKPGIPDASAILADTSVASKVKAPVKPAMESIIPDAAEALVDADKMPEAEAPVYIAVEKKIPETSKVSAGTGKIPEVELPAVRQVGWHLSGGLLYRTLGKISFRRGVTTVSAEGQSSPSRSGDRADVGSLGGYANREYDDGYVRVSAPTAGTGLTWYWGYENASQVGGGKLVFHASDGFETDFSGNETAGELVSGDNDGFGVFVQVERELRRTGNLTYGVEINLSRAVFSISEETALASAEDWKKYEVIIEDSYNLSGIVPPAPPYQGPSGGPGPLIVNIPSQRREIRNIVESGSYDLAIREALDLDLTTLSLGLNVDYGSGSRHYRIAGGPTVSLAETDAMHEEILSSQGAIAQILQDRSEDVNVSVGAYIYIGVGIRITERIGMDLFGRYDWLEDISGEVGSSKFDIDPAGSSFGAALSWVL